MKMIAALRTAFLLLSSVIFSSLVQAAPTQTIQIATTYGENSFHTRNLQQFAEELKAASGGRVVAVVHPGGTLLKPDQIFPGVRTGKADAGEVMMSSLARDIPLFGIDALPFIVSGYEDAQHMWDVSRSGVEKALRERGLQLLYAVPWPPQNLYSKTPINSISEFKGLRMRSYNPASERIAELIGARPVPIEVIDLENGIRDGKFDLMLTSAWTGVEAKSWSRMRYYYKVNAWIPKNVIFINKGVFDRLDPEVRKAMLEAANRAEQRGWRLSRLNAQDFEDQLAAHKINVSNVDPYIRGYLDRIGEHLAREWLKQAGSEELTILLRYTTERSMK